MYLIQTRLPLRPPGGAILRNTLVTPRYIAYDCAEAKRIKHILDLNNGQAKTGLLYY